MVRISEAPREFRTAPGIRIDKACCAVQVLVNEMQQKLGNLDAEASAARDRAHQMEAKASSLESEKALLATAEQRLTNMINDLSAEKHKLMAQSQVAQKVGPNGDILTGSARLWHPHRIASEHPARVVLENFLRSHISVM